MKAVVAHAYLAWIHPFGDGNGRTARLLEAQILSQAGLPIIVTNLLSDHYNLTRDRYYAELKRASENGGDLTSFVSYATEGFVDRLRAQVKTVRDGQRLMAWQNFVHEQVQGHTEAARRRRCLLIDLQLMNIYKKDDLALVSVRVARMYGAAGDRTLPRDVNTLVKEGLLLKLAGNMYVANSARIAAFSPTFDSETP